MSLHAQISPEAIARLRAQKRNTIVSSIIISILALLLLCIVLLYLLLPPIESNTAQIVSYQGNIEENPDPKKPKPTRVIKPKPTPASSTSYIFNAKK